MAQGNAQFLLWLTEQLADDHSEADVAPLRIPDLRSYLSNDLRKVCAFQGAVISFSSSSSFSVSLLPSCSWAVQEQRARAAVHHGRCALCLLLSQQ